jgi:myxalamid-type polyketide synthase MxaB
MTPEVEQAQDRRALLKEALLAVEQMQARLEAVERAKNEPIAVVGMSCRFPGANNVEAYWHLLQTGQDAVRPVPPGRWNVEDYDTPEDESGNKPIWYGGFLDHIDQFDPAFFGISAREATTLDPQQRLVLEVTWEALENAAIPPDSLNGSRAGIFVGITTHDYLEIAKSVGLDEVDVYTATGNALNAAPGRVAYTLGLQGPSVAVDTACSSSLVALHLACQSLRSGESTLALAGGVNALLSPDGFVIFSRWGMMAKDGRCKTFDSRADGFVRGEGCGMLVLKKLSDAQKDGDPILAVIHGSAVNQDGRSSGLTVPNGRAQQAVIRQALANAGLQPSAISYVEAHGTGTTLGDPIEVEAIGAVLGEGRSASQPLVVGSVKTNLGHLESASGIAGVIKTILALQHHEIPPHLHLQERSPRIPWPNFEVTIPTKPLAWEPANGQRYAGVSSFGFSGTNAHVVLGEVPETASRGDHPSIQERSFHLLPLSARSVQALHDVGERFQNYLTRPDAASLADVAYTVASGRASLPYRAAVVAADAADAARKLAAFASGQEAAGVVTGQAHPGRAKIAFLFTGQGSQYAGMGREFYQTQPVFRAALDECAALLENSLGCSLLDLIFGEADGRLNDTRFTQPTLFALEYAMARMWQSWGVEPDFVMGHSVGEYVAAVLAGVMTLETGARLIAERGRLMGALPPGGQMAAVFADEAQVREVIAGRAGQLSIAGVNAPDEIVISGAGEAVEAAINEFTTRGVKTRRLVVSHAFHSPLMEPMLRPFERSVNQAGLATPRIKLISNVTGKLAGAEVSTPAYWVRHVREGVRFADGMRTLYEAGCRIFLEVGPKPTLVGLGQRCIPEGMWLPTLREGKGDWSVALESLGRLYVEGWPVNWSGFDEGYSRSKVSLPVNYPFQRARYWVEQTKPRRKSKSTGHPLLGERLDLAHEAGTVIWQGELDLSQLAYLDDHRVQGVPVVPATAYMEMAMAAARQAFDLWPALLTEVENRKMLILPPGGEPPVVQVAMKRRGNDEAEFSVYSRATVGSWTLHATGVVSRIPMKDYSEVLGGDSLQAVQARCTETLSGQAFYRQLAEKGNEWGPNFQGIEHLWRGQGEGLSRIRVPDALVRQLGRYQFHPAVSDFSGHILAATVSLQKSEDDKGGAFVGGGVRETRVYRNPTSSTLWAYARLQPDASDDPNILIGDVAVFDDQGNLISETLGARLWYLDHQAAQELVERVEDWFYEVGWEALEMPETVVDGTKWLILADQSGFGEALGNQIVARGAKAALAYIQETGFQQLGEDCYSVGLEAASLQRLLAEVQPGRIAHLWGLDARPDNLDMAQYVGPESLRALMGALAGQESVSPRISLVTCGAQAVNAGDVANPLQAVLWGMARPTSRVCWER